MRDRIRQACARAGRAPSTVTIVAVTKDVTVERMREAAAAGIEDFGENRVQEALEKQRALTIDDCRLSIETKTKSTIENRQSKILDGSSVRWHLIGHLQRNKAGDAARMFSMVHSVDSVELAQALARHAPSPLQVLVQVNVSGEATKSGCRPGEAAALAAAVQALPALRLAGLMTIAPWADSPEQARPVFRALRELRDRLQAQGSEGLKLSMGMSQDFEVAIEEGADLVRIGTAIFGERGKGKETR